MPEEPKSPKLDLKIDPFKLEEHVSSFPNEYYQWAKAYADADAEYQKRKALLDHKKAELDLDVRKNPDHYKIEKVTEKTVENTVITQPEYKLAIKKMDQARHQMKEIEAAVKALEGKRKMITMAVELWIREYYAEMKTVDKDQVRSRGRRRKDEEREDDDE